MGYRSEVVLVVSREGLSKLYQQIPDAMREVSQYADSFCQKDDAYFLKWEYIKWYDSFSEIAALESALVNDLENDQYHFLRLGEEDDDVEQHGSFWDNPFDTRISRMVVSDTSGSKPVDHSLLS